MPPKPRAAVTKCKSPTRKQLMEPPSCWRARGGPRTAQSEAVLACTSMYRTYLYVCVHISKKIRTNTYHSTYPYVRYSSPTGLNRTKIRAITYQIHTHTYQYIPKYIPIRVRFAPHKRVPGPYVWVCTVVCIGMYCVFMLVCICTYVLI